MPRTLPSGPASGSGSLSTSPRPPPHRGLHHIGSSAHLFVPGQTLHSQSTAAAAAAAAAAHQQPPPMHVQPHSHSVEDLSHSHSAHEVAAMAVSPHPAPQRCRRVLVTGGSGFLGRHLIQTLLGLGHEIHCFDLVQSFHDARVRFFLGDLGADTETLTEACTDVDTVFHTASLTDPLASLDAIRSVNVTGTRNVIAACLACGVRNLIYTSTTAVIFNGSSIEGLREDQCSYPRSYLDPYSACKAEAERLVVAANGTVSPRTGEALCTVSLRPHAIFGPRDTHFISQLILRARSGEITHMIGSGRNLVDFTYIGNVVHAEIITMDKLSAPVSAFSSSPAGARELSSEFLAARARIGGQCFFITNDDPRPFWAFISLILNEVGCIGPSKHISYPVAYVMAWIMEWVRWVRRVLKWVAGKFKMGGGGGGGGASGGNGGKKLQIHGAATSAASNEAEGSMRSTPGVLLSPVDAAAAAAASSSSSASAAASSSSSSSSSSDQDQVGLTRYMVCVMSKTQFYSISKARELLGYEPIITLDQGLDMTINYFFRRRAAPAPAAAATAPAHNPATAHMGRYAGTSSALSHQQHQQQLLQQQQQYYSDAAALHQWQLSQASSQVAGAAPPAGRLLTRVHSLPSTNSALLGAPGGQPFPPAPAAAAASAAAGSYFPATPQHPEGASYAVAVSHAMQQQQQQQLHHAQSAFQMQSQSQQQWPHRHHSTSPFTSTVDAQQQQQQQHMQGQQHMQQSQYAPRSLAPPQPPQPPHYYLAVNGSVSPFPNASSSSAMLQPPAGHPYQMQQQQQQPSQSPGSESYLAPNVRGIPNVPSSAFLNAYAIQQQMPAANAGGQQQQQAR